MFSEQSKCASDRPCVDERITSMGTKLDQVEFVADHPGKHDDGDDLAETTESLVALISNAHHTMIFQTPYLVVPKGKYFKKLRKENPEMDIIVSTNSLAACRSFLCLCIFLQEQKNAT